MINFVAIGAALLDAKKPGWRDLVNLDLLDIGSCTQCILGQIFGSFAAGVMELGLKYTREDIEGKGFGIWADPASSQAHRTLRFKIATNLWKDEIESKRVH